MTRSPDLNIVENCLARAVYQNERQFININELKKMHCGEVGRTKSFIKKLYECLPQRRSY